MRKLFIIPTCFLLMIGCYGNEKSIEPLSTESFLIIAHRGASTYAPEHTILAYEIAQQADADYIEVDLQMTKDGELVAMHDEKVDRTTDGKGFVKEYTLDELKLLNAGRWFNNNYPSLANSEYKYLNIPTLDEIFSYFGDSVNYHIEMKSPGIYEGMEEKLVALIKKYKLIYVDEEFPKIVIESFDGRSLLKVHELEPKLPLIQLFSFKEEAALSIQDYKRLNTYASGIGVNISSVDKDFIQEVKLNGLHILLYSISSEIEMKQAINLKANGAYTNNPEMGIRVRRLLEQ
ncbi:glycerophosphodiester phosphodiesterase family protein [Psychrobacillus sp. NPDC058041]|uniref:glycerophosphodiester phosphodiesterase family protein n=1 Tax=Psychrobacillus sp. NPDC058041 TaxID=3346310 RepID=UPI0036DD2163